MVAATSKHLKTAVGKAHFQNSEARAIFISIPVGVWLLSAGLSCAVES